MSVGSTTSDCATGFHPGEAAYHQIVDAAVEGIWIANQESRLRFRKPAITRMLGHVPEEMYVPQALMFGGAGILGKPIATVSGEVGAGIPLRLGTSIASVTFAAF